MRKALLGLAFAAILNLVTMGLNLMTTEIAQGVGPHAARAEPTVCLPSLLPLPRVASESHVLSPGVTLRVYVVRQPTAPPTVSRRAYISIVEVSHQAAHVAPVTAGVPLLLHPAEPMRQRDTIAVMNGDYFEPLRRGDAVPTGALVSDGAPLFLPHGNSDVVAVGSDGLLRKTKVFVTGQAKTAQGRLSISAINDPLAGEDVTVAFTPAWQRTVPTGRQGIIVKNGAVTKIVSTTRNLRVPENGAVILVSKAVSTDAFSPSSTVELDLEVSARDGRDVVSASGHGGAFLVAGRVMPACSAYENSLRPRSMLAWNEAGDAWLMTASTRQPDPPGGVRIGGATKTQLAQIARSLGATWAVTMDGGGSTSLYARVNRETQRMDLPDDAWARPVPVLWVVRVTR